MQNGSKRNLGRNGLFKAYGLLIDHILDSFNVPKPRTKAKKELHMAFKDAFGVETLTCLDFSSLSLYIDLIKAYFATEHGVYIRAANEPGGVDRMTLSQYLKYMNEPKTLIYEKLDETYDLDTRHGRLMLLCHITQTPWSSIIGNEERLFENIREWINFG